MNKKLVEDIDINIVDENSYKAEIMLNDSRNLLNVRLRGTNDNISRLWSNPLQNLNKEEKITDKDQLSEDENENETQENKGPNEQSEFLLCAQNEKSEKYKYQICDDLESSGRAQLSGKRNETHTNLSLNEQTEFLLIDDNDKSGKNKDRVCDNLESTDKVNSCIIEKNNDKENNANRFQAVEFSKPIDNFSLKENDIQLNNFNRFNYYRRNFRPSYTQNDIQQYISQGKRFSIFQSIISIWFSMLIFLLIFLLR